MLFSCLSMVSCGSDADVDDYSESEDYTEPEDSYITFKSAAETHDPMIWYVLSDINGRSSNIIAALVFEDGKVRIYRPFYGGLNLVPFGTLEDYYSLSDEEAIDLLQERYEETYRYYYELFNKEPNDETDPNGTKKACYEQLLDYKIQERPLDDYQLYFMMDQTGNAADHEIFYAEYVQERRPIDRGRENSDMPIVTEDYYLPEDHEDFHVDAALAFRQQIEPIEVYDTYFGGYTCWDAHAKKTLYDINAAAIVTKCQYDTVFEMDELGTEGIEEIY